jgi:hypothetical protein
MKREGSLGSDALLHRQNVVIATPDDLRREFKSRMGGAQVKGLNVVWKQAVGHACRTGAQGGIRAPTKADRSLGLAQGLCPPICSAGPRSPQP